MYIVIICVVASHRNPSPVRKLHTEMVTPKTKSGYQVKSIDWKLHIDGQNLEKLSSVGVRAEVCILIEASFCRWRLSASLLYCRCLQLALRLRRWRGGKSSSELLVRANSGWESSCYCLLRSTCDARLWSSASLLWQKNCKSI